MTSHRVLPGQPHKKILELMKFGVELTVSKSLNLEAEVAKTELTEAESLERGLGLEPLLVPAESELESL